MSSSKNQSWMQKGFSLVEVTVAMGLLGIATVAVMNLTDNIHTNASRAEASVARSQFASELGTYLNSERGCKEFLNGTFPLSKTSTVQVGLSNWKHKNSVDKNGNKINILRGDIGATPGTTFKNFRVKSLAVHIDPGAGWASLPKANISGIQHAKTNLRVALKLYVPEPTNRDFDYFYNIPVLVRSTGLVAFCNQEQNLQEMCTAMKGTLNAAGICEFNQGCESKGTFKQLSCSPSNYGCSSAEGSTVNNPFTNNVTCPADSVRYQTATKTWNHTVNCGKKCSTDVVNTMNWYSCLKCP